MLTANVWATPMQMGRNRVSQLLVPATDAMEARPDGESMFVESRYGTWPATHGSGRELSTLTAVVPRVARGRRRVTWAGPRTMADPAEVRRSHEGAIAFRPHTETDSLRRPQIAALHSIIGYQTSGLTEPAIVVMPTGTGKTETMLAWLVAARPEHLLVLVPSVFLRDQIAAKFETLGVLQRESIVASSALRPRVGRFEEGISDAQEAIEFVKACNVIVATPAVLQACAPDARRAILDGCTHLVVDEAHHAPARTWTEVIQAFAARPVLLFTATPFREDKRPLPGRIISRFPLREAQADGYFSDIDFKVITGLDDPDEELAGAALARIREDIAAGNEHVMLVRTANRPRAEEIHQLYTRLAPELSPQLLHDGLSITRQREARDALANGETSIVVCVNMLGEGFDEPRLKVGAFHDVRRTLSPMLQLIGRLTRTASEHQLGTASVFVRRDPGTASSPLRDLLREDPDWNTVLRDVTDRATVKAEEVSEFDSSFDVTPSDVPVALLEPKMSAVAFRTAGADWDPDAVRSIYGDALLDGAISVGGDNDTAWFIVEVSEGVRWGQIPGLSPTAYDLIIMYLDRRHGLLFIYGSDTEKGYSRLADAVLGTDAAEVRGADTFRVFAGLQRLIPTNVGLLDARDRDRRFSMFVGRDVEAALNEADQKFKTNTHIAAKAFEEGESMTIAAALSGRFWSMRSAAGLWEWREWCFQQGMKLIDGTIDLRTLFRDMIVPAPIAERPQQALLALEWPWRFYTGDGSRTVIRVGEATSMLTDVELRVDEYATSGPFLFSIVTDKYEVPYRATIVAGEVRYTCVSEDAAVEARGHSTPLSTWLNANKPTLFLAGDRMITPDDRLLEPRTDVLPYDRAKLQVLDWTGVNIKVESQGVHREQSSIQAFASRYLRDNRVFDVMLDDDRSGEAADLVGLRIDGQYLVVTLVHCKYSSGEHPGGRLQDLYEVCGQAVRGARWRDSSCQPLLKHLDERAQAHWRRTGVTAYELGDRVELLRLWERAGQLIPRFETIIMQPGLSVRASSVEQLRLLAGADSYVRAVTKGAFAVYCSE